MQTVSFAAAGADEKEDLGKRLDVADPGGVGGHADGSQRVWVGEHADDDALALSRRLLRETNPPKKTSSMSAKRLSAIPPPPPYLLHSRICRCLCPAIVVVNITSSIALALASSQRVAHNLQHPLFARAPLGLVRRFRQLAECRLGIKTNELARSNTAFV